MTSAPATSLAKPARPLNIAIVDDYVLIREALAKLLIMEGHEVVTFGSGEEFIAAASRRRFDCILLDIELGACMGFEVAAHPAVVSLGIPMIFMTGSNDPTFPLRAAEAGCVAFLRKPFAASTLIEALSLVQRAGIGLFHRH